MTEVFELTYHGGGGFTYSEVWNMDVPKRRFNIKKIHEHLDRVNEEREKASKQMTSKNAKSFAVPDFANPNSSHFVSKVKSKK